MLRKEGDQVKHYIHDHVVVLHLEVVHDVVIEAIDELLHCVALLLHGDAWLTTLAIILAKLAQEEVVEEDEASVDKILNHFFVLIVVLLHMLPVFEDVEGEFLRLLAYIDAFELGKDVRDGHQCDRSLLQGLRLVLDYHLKTLKEVHIFDSLNVLAHR